MHAPRFRFTRRKFRPTSALLASAFFATSLLAQQAAPAPAPAADPAKEEVIELSPFVVSADTERGWVATQSLAGSRLKTDLKDIAAPVEVMTKDFMDDFGLTSVADAAIYTTNVEGAGDNVELGAGFGFGTGFPPPTRVRGLRNANNSREFFEVRMSSDNYNLDRITIASGPNNLLFGSGSPAGTIDTSLKRALFKNQINVDLLFDSNATQRYAFDVNQELIDKKLAIRVAAVREDKKFEYEPARYDHRRYYGTFQLKPFEKTTISAHFEKVKVDNIRPQLLLPFDNITPWYNATSYTGYTHTSNQPEFVNPAFTAALPTVPGTTVFTRGPSSPIVVLGNSGGLVNGSVQNYSRTVSIKSPKDVPGVDPLNNEADGYTLLDGAYYPLGLDMGGLSKLERIDDEIMNLFVTQQIGRNFFLEFAAQKETYEGWNTGMMSFVTAYRLNVDPNKFAPDGVTPNPNFGKQYIEGGNNGPYRAQTLYDSQDWRVSASYEYDFLEKGNAWWNKVLGRHRLAALYSSRKSEDKNQELFARILPQGGVDPVLAGFTFTPTTTAGWADNATRQLQYRYYLGADDMVPIPNYDLFASPTFKDDAGRVFTLDMMNTGLVDGEGRRLGAGRINTFIKSYFKTKQLAYQGFFWDNRLVATLGWRQDSTNSTGGNLTEVAVPGRVNTGLRPLVQDVAFVPYDDTKEQTGPTRTRGFVARPLRGFVKLPLDADISVAWNRSNTFQPDTSLFDPYNNRIPGALGSGEDKSIRVDLMEGKFNVRYTEFENTDGPARAGNVPFNRFRFDLFSVINRARALENIPNGTGLGGPGMYPTLSTNGGDPYGVASNRSASGKEWGMDWNVTKNFQLRFNMNKQQVIESDIGDIWWQFLDTELPKFINEFNSLNIPEGGVTNPRDLNANGVIDTWRWDTAWITDSDSRSLAQRYDEVAIRGSNGKDIIQSLDGRPNEFVRENRFNVNWQYKFDSGALKGLKVGGAYRYRAAPVLSFNKKIVNGIGALDIDNPFYGKVERYIDLSINYERKLQDSWLRAKKLKLGLNVRNILDDTELIDKLINVSGQAVRRAKPYEGRTFIFTLGLEY